MLINGRVVKRPQHTNLSRDVRVLLRQNFKNIRSSTLEKNIRNINFGKMERALLSRVRAPLNYI